MSRRTGRLRATSRDSLVRFATLPTGSKLTFVLGSTLATMPRRLRTLVCNFVGIDQLQRPIVVQGERAILGRPPENVLALLDNQE